MTDITDQDRRDARAWAEFRQIASHVGGWKEESLAAARVILATVDAPAPTLAEELARIAENSPVWTIQNVCDELKSAADRAEQMERDLKEARAEVERLTAERDEARENEASDSLRQQARAWSEVWNHPVMEAAVPGEGTGLSRALKVLDGLHSVQKGAESNAESIDPADVKPGEAWIVEVNGKRGTAMKDGDSLMPWGVVTDGTFSSRDAGEITLVSRLVPAPRVITNPDELDQAKHLTVIRDGMGVVCERASLGNEWFPTGNGIDQTPYIQFPVTVLWEPKN